ncbi:hypothetical protein GE061_003266 [Apolygus lucorum]|uniref:SCP domain-containing protein n=1 Tax=Apolygus lucorum TaxID=248454 RepID=A0A8S9X3F1_APOLU|nr:hypothetical protein GE061_003266 [Apolygus lucorum]
MWFSFTLITLLGLLRAGTSQDNSSLCINPTDTPMIGLANYEVKMVWTKFVSMRDESENVHASFALSCGREPLVWDDSLALYAYNEVGKKCPTEGKPFVPGFKEGTSKNKEELGIITVFGLDYDFLILGVTSTWDNLINSLEEGKARALSEKYEKGPWDPVFQVLWADTKKVGCAITIYNVSDFQAASKIFNKPVDKNSVPWNLVCAFNPKGSIAGEYY